jgi:predicted metal-binding transcription factor (methanogenesis marker protein 9)
MTKEFLEILKKELLSLSKSMTLFQGSYDRCCKIGDKANYSSDELESFEALTARYSRLSDLLLQKIFRLIDSLELVDQGTVVDRINRAEKRGIVKSAKEFTELRYLRNTIVHEYEPDEYVRIFKDVMKATPILLDSVEKTKLYCQKF